MKPSPSASDRSGALTTRRRSFATCGPGRGSRACGSPAEPFRSAGSTAATLRCRSTPSKRAGCQSSRWPDAVATLCARRHRYASAATFSLFLLLSKRRLGVRRLYVGRLGVRSLGGLRLPGVAAFAPGSLLGFEIRLPAKPRPAFAVRLAAWLRLPGHRGTVVVATRCDRIAVLRAAADRTASPGAPAPAEPPAAPRCGCCLPCRDAGSWRRRTPRRARKFRTRWWCP